MLKRFIAVSVLLLVSSVQALTANCELRCTMMARSNQTCGTHSVVELSHDHAMHCHGMSMEPAKGNHAISADTHCRASVCKIRLEAVAKQTLTTESLSRTPSSPDSVPLVFDTAAVRSIEF